MKHMKEQLKGGNKKMNKNKTMFVAGVIGSIFLIALVAAAYTPQKNMGTNKMVNMDEMHKAMNSGNYDTWKSAHSNGGCGMRDLTKENFELMQQMHSGNAKNGMRGMMD